MPEVLRPHMPGNRHGLGETSTASAMSLQFIEIFLGDVRPTQARITESGLSAISSRQEASGPPMLSFSALSLPWPWCHYSAAQTSQGSGIRRLCLHSRFPEGFGQHLPTGTWPQHFLAGTLVAQPEPCQH